MDKLPKPVVMGAIAALVLLALVLVFRAAKTSGDGDFNRDDIRRHAQERLSQPNQGRTAVPGGQK